MRPASPESTSSISTTTSTVATPAFLRLDDVLRTTGLARSTVYRLMARHEFPLPCRLGPRAVGWRTTDIAQWSAARPSASR